MICIQIKKRVLQCYLNAAVDYRVSYWITFVHIIYVEEKAVNTCTIISWGSIERTMLDPKVQV